VGNDAARDGSLQNAETSGDPWKIAAEFGELYDTTAHTSGKKEHRGEHRKMAPKKPHDSDCVTTLAVPFDGDLVA